jgi:hypothetical protein
MANSCYSLALNKKPLPPIATVKSTSVGMYNKLGGLVRSSQVPAGGFKTFANSENPFLLAAGGDRDRLPVERERRISLVSPTVFGNRKSAFCLRPFSKRNSMSSVSPSGNRRKTFPRNRMAFAFRSCFWLGLPEGRYPSLP